MARHAYLVAAFASCAWAAMLFTYTIGYVGGLSGLMRAPMQLAVVCLMAVLPAVFVFLAAFVLRQGARLAAEALWARSLAEDMVGPAALAVASTADMAGGLREEIERVSASAVAAHGQLISVREALSGETERLNEAAAQAQHTARAVGETLAGERETLSGLFVELKAAGEAIASGVERQSRLVGEASDLARSQLQEAEATLASGAERLAAASADAGSAARDAGDGLTRQAERLDVAAAALSERLRFLDARLNEQRGALSGLMQTLEHDQDDLAARLETHRAQLLDVAAEAHAGASEISAASSRGGDALRELVAAAVEQTRDLAAALRSEQGALREEAAEARREAQTELQRTLDAMARAGEDARRALAAEVEQTGAVAQARIGAARSEVEQLGELAFVVGQRADQAFQSRLGEARRMIEQTAGLVEDAGQRAGQRIESGLGASRGALGELAAALGDIEGQLARLPDAARLQAEAVRAAVERSLQELTAAAKRTAEETQGIDAAFQDRIRRNYETLSEAVRLMGRVAGAVDFGRDLAPPRPAGVAAAPHILEPAPAPADPAAAPPQASEAPEPERVQPPWPELAIAPPERKPAFAAPRGVAKTPVFGRAAAREAQAAAASAGPADALFEPAEPEPVETAARETAAAEAPGLRPRLRFTPTPADEALKAVFAAAPAQGEPDGATGARSVLGRGQWDAEMDEWTWKDLLTSIHDAPADGDALAEQMSQEIEALGVDAAALLPRARLEDVAASLVAGDRPAARDAVRRLAPAAIRRLSRRVLTDAALREQVDRFVDRYVTLLGDAGRQDDPSRAMAGLLADDAGRAYLLLEAAVGDL